MSEIKRCPFCGNHADYWEDHQYSDRHVIECMNCGTNKRSEYGYESVLEDWNRRFDKDGQEVVEISGIKHRPILTARVGYKTDGTGEFNDVVIWKGPLMDTPQEAYAVADGAKQEVQILATSQIMTEDV